MSSSIEEHHSRSFLFNLVQLSGAGFFSQVMGTLTSYVNAYVLEPALLGSIKAATLVETYAGYNDFGVIFGMNLELPIARGQGKNQQAENLKNTAFTLTLLLSVITLLALVAAFIFGWNFNGQITYSLLLFILLLIITNRLDAFLTFTLRAENRFDVASKRRALEGLLSPLLGIPMLVLWKVPGVLLSVILVRAIHIAMGLYWARLSLYLQFNPSAAIQLIKVGIFSFLTNLENRLLRGLEMLVIAQMLLPSDLGLFGFALSALAITDIIPESARQIFFRRITFEQGKYGEQEPGHLFRYFKSPLVLYLLLSTLLCGVCYFGYAFLIPYILPKYQASVPVFLMLAIGEAFYKVRVFAALSMTAIKRLKLLLVIQGLALGFNAYLDITFVKSGYGILGAATGSTIAYFVFALIFLAVMYALLKQPIWHSVFFFVKLTIAASLCWGWLWILASTLLTRSLSSGRGSLLTDGLALLGQVLFFVPFCILIFALLFKEQGIWGEIIGRAQSIYKILVIKVRSVQMTGGK